MINLAVSNVLSTFGTICWCIQLTPQIIFNWRRKSTDGLPTSMMFLWVISALPFGIYMVLQDVAIPLQIQPQIFAALSAITWCQCLYYGEKYSKAKAILVGLATCALMGAVELFQVLALKAAYSKGTTWPGLVIGIVATVLFVFGFVPPLLELWKDGGRVVGINFFFLGIDITGAVTSLVSLVFEGSFDILGGVLYITVIVCEVTIILSHLIWFLRFRHLIKEAAEQGKTFDKLFAERGGKTRYQKKSEAEPQSQSQSQSQSQPQPQSQPAVTENTFAPNRVSPYQQQKRFSGSSTVSSLTPRDEKSAKTPGLNIDVASAHQSGGSSGWSPQSPVPSYHTSEYAKKLSIASIV